MFYISYNSGWLLAIFYTSLCLMMKIIISERDCKVLKHPSARKLIENVEKKNETPLKDYFHLQSNESLKMQSSTSPVNFHTKEKTTITRNEWKTVKYSLANALVCVSFR